jgi:hypothetical protein
VHAFTEEKEQAKEEEAFGKDREIAHVSVHDLVGVDGARLLHYLRGY